MADVQIAVIDQQNVQIAVIDPENTQLALAAPAEAVVNVAVPGIQGPVGTTGSVTIAQAGTAATPGIRFESDTNTGIYSPGADQVALATAGTGRLFVDATGNVGIGAAPGAYKFDVQGGGQRILSQGSTSFLEIGNGTATSQAAFIDFTTDTTYTDYGLRFIRDAAGANSVSQLAHRGTGDLSLRCLEAAPLTFYTTNTERARIDSSGRLLLGTSTSVNTFGVAPVFQIAGGEAYQSTIAYRADAFAPFISVGHSRSATIGTQTVLQSGDDFGTFAFVGSDGTGLIQGARISAQVDGTPGTNDMPGRLVFSTTADGAASPTERLRITSAGNVGIGTAAPGDILSLTGGNIALQSTGGAGAGDRPTERRLLRSDIGSTNGLAAIGMNGAGTNGFLGEIKFYTGSADLFNTALAERARIDSSGRLLVGTSSARSNYYGSITPGGIQIETGTQSLFQNSNNATGPALYLGKSRGATVNSNTVVQANDQIGSVIFFGADGTNVWPGAQIVGEVDGTPGTNDMPGRLVFSTTADGAATPTERLRITSAGNVGIGTASPATLLQCQQASAGTVGTFNLTSSTGGGAEIRVANGYSSTVPIYSFWFNNTTGIGNPAANEISAIISGSERARIDSSGRLLVGTSSSTNTIGVESGLQVQGTGAGSFITSARWAASADNPGFIFAKSRGAAVGTRAVVSSNDVLGAVYFSGDDGTNFIQAALITATVDGTPGTNDMPGRLVFSTTADGAASPTERLRITSTGVLQIADAGNITVGTTTGTKIGTGTTQKIGFYNATPVVQPTAVANATDAASVITQFNALLTRMRNLGLIAT